MSYYYRFNFLIVICTLTALLGAVGGLNQTSLRKLLAFSSINNLRWIILALIIRENAWNFYFIIYTFIILIIITLFHFTNSFYLNQLFFYNRNNSIKFLLFLRLLSLGGLPPFLGFLNKWIIINFLINNNFYFITLILIITALITLFFYIRITYSRLIFNYLKLKWFKLSFKNNSLKIIGIISYILTFRLIIRTFTYYII